MTRRPDASPPANGRTRAVVLTTQRTGSTFLIDCLDSHPDIECASEILIGLPDRIGGRQYRGRFHAFYKLFNIARRGAWLPGNRMKRFYAGGAAQVRAFKAMYNHLANPFALRWLRRNEDVRVIHLRRHNLLKVHVSRLLMRARPRLQATAPVAPVWVTVDPDAAIRYMRKARAQQDRFAAAFSAHPLLELRYEMLIDRQQLREDTRVRLCEFLGVRDHPMKSALVKVNPESLREMVTNYDELAAAVRRTEFADMLE